MVTDLFIKKIREGVTEGRVGLSFVHKSVDTVPAPVTSDVCIIEASLLL